MKSRHTFDWTPERSEELAELYRGTQQSCSEIGKHFGVSRNSVIGKLHRLGLVNVSRVSDTDSRNARAVRMAATRERYASSRKSATDPKLFKFKPEPKPKPTPVPKMIATPAQPTAGVPFRSRTRRQCPYCVEPLNAPAHADMLVCGARVEEGERWCKAHRAIVFGRKAA